MMAPTYLSPGRTCKSQYQHIETQSFNPWPKQGGIDSLGLCLVNVIWVAYGSGLRYSVEHGFREFSGYSDIWL